MQKIRIIDSVKQYKDLLEITDNEKRQNYFRYDMMKEFKKMWDYLNVPIKAKQANGYDVLMATKMLGYADIAEDEAIQEAIEVFSEEKVYKVAERTLIDCLEKTYQAGLKVNAEEIIIGFYVADSVKLALSKGYAGFGGIPGYITITMYPNSYNLSRLPAVIAHEFHHNIRFSYFDWDHGNVTVGDYLVIEGLAESFAKELYGTEQLGPWVTSMDQEELDYSTQVIAEALDVKGFAEVSSYMFGDEIASQQGYEPVGLPYCAGYAVGYHVVQAYMNKRNKTIYEATLASTNEIIQGSEMFS